MSKKETRLKRAKRSRIHIRRLEAIRICIHKTPKHMYAQVISADGSKTLVSASTLDKELRDKISYTGNKTAAQEVGKLIAQRAMAAGINEVAFDRSGFPFHGRVKALADAAREVGLKF